MVDALHPWTYLAFQVFKLAFWMIYFPMGIVTTVIARVLVSGLIWSFWWIFQVSFLSGALAGAIASFSYGVWVACTFRR